MIGEQPDLGRRILAARLVLGMTQDEAAQVIGVTRSQVANAEAGRTDLTASGALRLLDLAGALPSVPESEATAHIRVAWAEVCRAAAGLGAALAVFDNARHAYYATLDHAGVERAARQLRRPSRRRRTHQITDDPQTRQE